MSATVQCDRCGNVMELHGILMRRKGEGKRTGEEQSKLSLGQVWTLRIVGKLQAIRAEIAAPKFSVYDIIRQEALATHRRIPQSQMLTFWLSSLRGAGFLSMANRVCQIRDKDTMEIRFRKKPVWYLSEAYLRGSIGFDSETRKIWRLTDAEMKTKEAM